MNSESTIKDLQWYLTMTYNEIQWYPNILYFKILEDFLFAKTMKIL